MRHQLVARISERRRHVPSEMIDDVRDILNQIAVMGPRNSFSLDRVANRIVFVSRGKISFRIAHEALLTMYPVHRHNGMDVITGLYLK